MYIYIDWDKPRGFETGKSRTRIRGHTYRGKAQVWTVDMCVFTRTQFSHVCILATVYIYISTLLKSDNNSYYLLHYIPHSHIQTEPHEYYRSQPPPTESHHIPIPIPAQTTHNTYMKIYPFHLSALDTSWISPPPSFHSSTPNANWPTGLSTALTIYLSIHPHT